MKENNQVFLYSIFKEPPVPSNPDNVYIEVTAKSQNVVNLRFSDTLLNSSNGPVEAYGVLLSTDYTSRIFLLLSFEKKYDALNICYNKIPFNVISGDVSNKFLTMTYSDWEQKRTKAYLTVLKYNKNRNIRSNMITIEIGNYSDVLINTEYVNGPLSNQDYR